VSGDLAGSLAALQQLTEAARPLGLDTGAAEAALARARARLGFPGSAFVLALAGGTGVGKSSLLNALAGTTVSKVGPIRPTTGEPVAWVPADQADELGSLLGWIGVERVVTHRDPAFQELCLVDLPDYDSVERGHRASVDELLTKVDAVCWVLDPAKYNDRTLHEDYLRPLAHHADRAVFVLNRRDLLGTDANVAQVLADLRQGLQADGFERPELFAVAAAPTEGNAPVHDGDRHGDLARLRAWLGGRLEAKAVVNGRLIADCLAAGEALGRAAGVDGEQGGRPLVDAGALTTTRQRAVVATRTVVDIAGVRAACVRRVRAEAHAAGAGPLGRLIGWLAHRRGGSAGPGGANPDRSVDPLGYARGWRRRTTLARAVNPVRELARQAATAAPPELRAAVLRPMHGPALEERLGAAVDDAIAQTAAEPALRHGAAPRSALWPIIGVLQAVALGAVLVGLLWMATLALAGWAEADAPPLPSLHTIPMPLALVAGGLVLGLLLSRVLAASAARVGRRWADRLAKQLDQRVETELDWLGKPLAEIEGNRSELLSRLGDLRAAASRR
jgi:50S ribosome-binding GTPase